MNAVVPDPVHRARHCLVVATQCEAEQPLTGLVEVAEELHGVLTDPALGACRGSRTPAAQLVRSGRADQPAVEAAVRGAIVRAGEAHAVLVLAFVGHGQSPRGASRLYYMASNSLPEDANSSVDVNGLITAAANQQGVAGVIVLLDTCQSGAGLATSEALAGGFQGGQVRVAVLAAAPAGEPAYALDFTRQITRRIREGFDDAGEFVPVSFYRDALIGALRSQDAVALLYDGVPAASEDGLWLAVNARRGPVNTTGGLGRIGRADLAAALRAWPQGTETGETGGRDGLLRLRELAARSQDFAALRVREVADALLLAHDTAAFLLKWAGRELTSYTVHRAMAELNTLRRDTHEPLRADPGLSGSGLLTYFLEHAALRQTTMDGRRTPVQAVARCVVAVAEACELDASGSDVQQWADAHGVTVELNDAREWSRYQQRQRETSLVVSLHAARIDWPDSLSVWLRRGEETLPLKSFPCVPTQAGVEEALTEVVHWAEDQLPADARLHHIDMVVPAALLPTWRPEEVEVGLYLLGVDRTVVLRWTDRLFVPRHFRGINDTARTRLTQWQHHVLTTGQAPVDWLDPLATGDGKHLRDQLRKGSYQWAIGIGQRSRDFTELVQTLLPYTPVLLWPGEEHHVVHEPPPALARYWEKLPAEFVRAHQLRWSGQSGTADCPPGAEDGDDRLAELAELRAAWHDLPWLDFCRWFQGNVMLSAGSAR
ncbi:vWA-MoxR associated conflict system protein [Streptomyces sp. NPDC004031]